MSLDFMLYDGENRVYDRNITHNLGKMASAAGIYKVLWRPDENGITKAGQCVAPLAAGLRELLANPEKYEAYNSPNGWGLYEHFVPFVADVLAHCAMNPHADVVVSR